MKKLLGTLLLSLFAQGGGQPINLPVKITSFCDGYGSSTSQDLGVTPAQLQEYRPGYAIEGVYTIAFTAANPLGNYPGYYRARLSFGTQELCDSSAWGKRLEAQITIVCSSPGYLIVDQSLSCDQNPCTVGPVQSAADLFLTVSVNGWTVCPKNLSVTFTPD